MLADDGEPSDSGGFGPYSLFGAPARLATNFFADTAFSGQVNLLTTGSFDSPQQLFTTENFVRSVADVSVGAPAAGHADWTVRGALTQGDVSSWIVAGSYVTRAPARHLYDVGMSYSTQRYNAGNPGAFHDVDGSRNAGVVYGFDTFTISPAIALTYGARYARYDYLDHRNLLSPRVALALTPVEHWRVNTLVSRRAVAPGAEEFVPPMDNSIWLPTQRTFSALTGGPLESERTTHAQLELERDFGRSTILVRGFLQQVDDQLVTVFGANMPGRPVASLGHYFVGKNGSVDASGWATGVRTEFADRVHASVEYTQTRGHWTPTTDLSYLIVVAPSATQPSAGRIHDVATTARNRRAWNVHESPGPLSRQQWLRASADAVSVGRSVDVRFALRRAGAAVAAVHGFQLRQVGDARRRPEFLPRDGARSVRLRRTARRASAETDRGRSDAALLAASIQIHNYVKPGFNFFSPVRFCAACVAKSLVFSICYVMLAIVQGYEPCYPDGQPWVSL